jgi:hypothetical protein
MSSKFAKIALAAGGFILLLVLVGAISLYIWVNRWLAGEECRKVVSDLVSKELKIEGSFQTLKWSGFSVYSESFTGRGIAGGSVRNIRAEQIRAELNFSALMRGTWEISVITVARMKVDLGATEDSTLSLPSVASDSPEKTGRVSIPFLPKDFLLKEVRF